MAFLNKVSDLGKSAIKKAGEGVEAGKITLKINEEKGKIKDLENELGKYYYQQYESGAALDDAASQICAQIKAKYEAIDELQRQRDGIGDKDDYQTAPAQGAAGKFCPNCGAKQDGSSKFCGGCGGKLEG